MDSDRLWLQIVLLIVFALLRAWYSACEAALGELNDAVVHTRAEQDERYAGLDALLGQRVRVRRSFTMHRILSALWIGVICAELFARPLARFFRFRDGALVAGLLLSMLLTLAIAVFTDLFPQRAARKNPETFARRSVLSVRVLIVLFTPLWAAASALTALLCKLFRVPASDSADVVTEEEIRLLVDAGNETGGIEESQREMINNIFTFDDVAVSDVMTHRKDMTAVSTRTTAVATASIALEGGFSRIPVYEDSVDKIVGVVLVKDLLPLVGKAEDRAVSEFMREALFVPETAKCRDVFQRMRKDKVQLAIVADEYGGTAGMVTMEDLLEEIVGSIQDEYDNEEAEFVEVSENVFSIAGSADPGEILPRLGVNSAEAEKFDTMSAYLVRLLGRIPEEGEHPVVEDAGVRYKVLTLEDNWIGRLEASPAAEESACADKQK